MSMMTSQITSLTIVYSIVYSGLVQRKHESSTSLAFVWGIHRWPVNSQHKGPVTRKMFPFDDVMLNFYTIPSILILNFTLVIMQSHVVMQFSIAWYSWHQSCHKIRSHIQFWTYKTFIKKIFLIIHHKCLQDICNELLRKFSLYIFIIIH